MWDNFEIRNRVDELWIACCARRCTHTIDVKKCIQKSIGESKRALVQVKRCLPLTSTRFYDQGSKVREKKKLTNYGIVSNIASFQAIDLIFLTLGLRTTKSFAMRLKILSSWMSIGLILSMDPTESTQLPSGLTRKLWKTWLSDQILTEGQKFSLDHRKIIPCKIFLSLSFLLEQFGKKSFLLTWVLTGFPPSPRWFLKAHFYCI